MIKLKILGRSDTALLVAAIPEEAASNIIDVAGTPALAFAWFEEHDNRWQLISAAYTDGEFASLDGAVRLGMFTLMEQGVSEVIFTGFSPRFTGNIPTPDDMLKLCFEFSGDTPAAPADDKDIFAKAEFSAVFGKCRGCII